MVRRVYRIFVQNILKIYHHSHEFTHNVAPPNTRESFYGKVAKKVGQHSYFKF